MPIYEYTCRKCNAHIEIMQKVTDKPLARHAKCGGKLEKEWSATSFQFKGTGWYVTDYAGKKAEGRESKEAKEAAGESSGKTDAKTDSKTDAKTDATPKTATTAKSDASAKTSSDTKATSKRSKAND
jgi:putative FmdB family regulatory protein